jgi:peptidoglycan/xylan/chitin deacetylase (PgdA/CDA1 family)
MTRAASSVPVLVYHSVARRSSWEFTIRPDLFEEHLRAIREQGFDAIPFRDVPAALASGRRAVAITIDDGLADAATNAAPVLLSLGLTATLFVPTAYVGDTARWLRGEERKRPMLSWGAVADLAGAGFEVASHGRLHLAVDVNPPELVRRDAAASKAELEGHLGHEVASFAYPFGYETPSARRAVRAAGFAQACSVGEFPARPRDDRWALPRLDVRASTTPEALLARINSHPSLASRGWRSAIKHTVRARRRWSGSARRTNGVPQ